MENEILSKHDITSLKSMGMYWEEVSKRDGDIWIILESELRDVIRHLGTRILWIILDYIRLLEEKDGKTKV